MSEAIERFDCFGGRCSVLVAGTGPAGGADEAVALVRRRLLRWHQQFSRFERDSELSRLNRDPRRVVPVSAMMTRFATLAVRVALATGGLVDPTLVGEIERAGYRDHCPGDSLAVADALSMAPPRAAAHASVRAAWATIEVDRTARTVTRPAGVQLDSGGIAKGLFGDVLADVLGGHVGYAVNAAGDVRLGGAGGWQRPVRVASPFDDSVLHEFELVHGAVATSGIGRRSWLDGDARPAHHLLDPATGHPAFTGIVQVTAIAPSGVEAEMRSKAALLSGPAGAVQWLPHGGLIVLDEGEIEVIEPSPSLSGVFRVPAVAAA